MKLYFAERGTGDMGAAITRADGVTLPQEPTLRGRDYFSLFGKFKVARTATARPGNPGSSRWTHRSTSPNGATRTSCKSG